MTIENPVLRGFAPDPSIVRAGDDYYIATSTFEWFPGVRLHHSRDLVDWRPVGHALTRTSQLDLRGVPDSGGVWAPSLSFADGRFWLVYANVRTCGLGRPFKDLGISLTTAPRIGGPWSDPISLGSVGFDPSLFHDEDGRKWLVNMSWDFRKSGTARFAGIVVQEFDPCARRLVGRITTILRKPVLIEGPNLHRRGGWYYLLLAEGGTGWDHGISVARSRDLLGPYEIDLEPALLTARDAPDHPLQKAGHGELVETPAGEWFLAHLASRPLGRGGQRRCILGRETCLQRVEWTDSGWPRLDRRFARSEPQPRGCGTGSARIRAHGLEDRLTAHLPHGNPDRPGLAVGTSRRKESAAPAQAGGGAPGRQADASYPERGVGACRPHESGKPWHPAAQVPAPAGVAPCPWPAPPARDDFDGPALDPSWSSLRIPATSDWVSLSARRGWLRLRGRDSLHSLFTQSLLAKPMRSTRCVIETCLEFAPERFTQMAGLVCYYDTRTHFYLRVTHEERTGVVLGIVQTDDGAYREPEIRVSLGQAALPESESRTSERPRRGGGAAAGHAAAAAKDSGSGSLASERPGAEPDQIVVNGWPRYFLRALIRDASLRFSASPDGIRWRRIGSVLDASKLSDDYGTALHFTGAMVGICAQDLGGEGAVADFDYFILGDGSALAE